MMGENNFSDVYEIIEQLGKGSGGIVYKAYHKRLRQYVVLKKMCGNQVSAEVKRKEVDILKNLHHSCLPKVLDFIETENEVYTVMSYIPGKSLDILLEKGINFTQNQLSNWGLQLCSALRYLHNQNPSVIHSDIKPANIMLTSQGDVVLIDFNISFYLDGKVLLGYSKGYTSPEQYAVAVEGKRCKIDERTDIYSLGATLYHLATGKIPSDCGRNANQQLLVQRTSKAFAEIIVKATQRNPEDRYQSALEMYRAFENIEKKEKTYKREFRRKLCIKLGSVVVLACCIVLAGYKVYQFKTERINKYNKIVKEQIESRENKEFIKQERHFEDALAINPSSLESYYQNAAALYAQEKYKECVEFIDYDICQNKQIDLTQERMADVYYLKADSLFRLNDYQNSIDSYEKVFSFEIKEAAYYRDYAIALAYSGKEDRAREILQKALELDENTDYVHYVKGEIEKALGNQEIAYQEFRDCIIKSENQELRSRAYQRISAMYQEQGDFTAQREILLEAKENVSVEYQMQILESLVQADIELGKREEAIIYLQEIRRQGWDSYETYNTLAVLYQKQNQLNEAKEMIDIMREQFGEDYNTYKRYAFWEIEFQNTKENENRDYGKFLQYYNKTVELYKKKEQVKDTDLEMKLLETLYVQLQKGNWIN